MSSMSMTSHYSKWPFQHITLITSPTFYTKSPTIIMIMLLAECLRMQLTLGLVYSFSGFTSRESCHVQSITGHPMAYTRLCAFCTALISFLHFTFNSEHLKLTLTKYINVLNF